MVIVIAKFAIKLAKVGKWGANGNGKYIPSGFAKNHNSRE